MSRRATPSLQENVSTRERIIRVGVSLFQANGYHGTGVAAILAEAQVPKGSFYYAFPGGKEQLAVEAIGWLAAEVDTFLDRLAASGASGTEMALGMGRYAMLGLDQADHMRGSLIATLAAEAVPGPPMIGAALNRAIDGWAGRLSAGFRREGVGDADNRAKVALAALEGATVLARIARRPALVLEIVEAALDSSQGCPEM